jgi:hypothetical protein
MALKIDVRLVGSEKILKIMKSIEGFFKSDELKTVLTDSMNRMTFIAGRLAPKGDSRLLSQVYGKIVNFGTKNVSVRIQSRARYAVNVEFSTRPHIILPRRKKVLFWTEYSTPKNVLPNNTGAVFTFAKEVHHPGTKEQPFLRPAVHAVQPHLIRAIHRVIQQKLKGA